jgi:glucan biosynthesis protein
VIILDNILKTNLCSFLFFGIYLSGLGLRIWKDFDNGGYSMWSCRTIRNSFSRPRIFAGIKSRAIFRVIASRCLFSLVLALSGSAFAQQNFTFDQVVAKAQQLVQEPYNPKAGLVPDFLLNIKYDAWRDIRFKPAKSFWRDEQLPFNVQFFHPGLYFPRAITINVVEPAGVRPIPFSTDLFEYEKMAAPLKKKIPSHLGFAGFRLHYPINTPAYFDEVAVFLGASYFRAVAQNSNYGLSARGISINRTRGISSF